MHFASDNAGPVPQQVLDALSRANQGYAPSYGSDPLSQEVVAQMRALFEAPEAAVYLVPTGTAANVLALACLCPPFGTVFCAPRAHIQEDECNAPEFYTGGAKLTLVGTEDQMTPEALIHAIENEGNRGVHGPLRGPVSITQVTEGGNTYSLDELRALTAVAASYDLPVHLDGARLANACARLDVSPAEMSWKSGVDICVFGGTKNGLMGAEAVVIFDPAKALEFELRRKRGAHLFSKHRYLAAQMQAYLADDLWLSLARQANAHCDALYSGLSDIGVSIATKTPANMLFMELPRATHQAIQAKGAVYHLSDDRDGPEDEILAGRLVCDWSQTPEAISEFLETVRRAL